jgi:Alr-MurF fusion protein
MQLTANDILHMAGATTEGSFIPDAAVSVFLTDSRKLSLPEQTLFFALTTKLRDGHQFIPQLYEKGVKHFVVADDYPDCKEFPRACFFRSQSPLKALQNIAASYRKKFSIPVISITGSNGKTVVKEWLHYLLSRHGSVVRSPKSFNSQIGVPLSVLLIEKYHKFAVFEAGISQPGEMKTLQEIIQPDFGIFTNIGPPHSENFLNDHLKIDEKLHLFNNIQRIVLCSSHEYIIDAAIKKGLSKETSLFLWGKNTDDDIRILSVKTTPDSTTFEVSFKSQTILFRIPFADEASYENAMHCFSCMMMMGFDPVETARDMENLPPVAMRLELHNGINNCIVVNDSYNSDLHSLSIALDFLKQQQQNRSACVILSDIMQSGLTAKDLHHQTASLLQEKNIERFIGIGPDLISQRNKFSVIPDAEFFADTQAFLNSVSLRSFNNFVILVKGSRDFGFERIAALFEQKTHQTVLEINLNAILHNLNLYRSKLRKETQVMAMIKAFAYGSGSHEIARFLEYHHVDYLGVAYADEGVELRNKGITMPVMVMAPEEASMDAIISNNLEPEIYSFDSLSWLQKYSFESVKIHLKFDTGMHRLGFDAADLEALCSALSQMPNITVASVFSHLSAADNPNDIAFTRSQISLFEIMYNKFCNLSKTTPKKHILNSAGISAFPEAQFDMVRLGLGLYGIQPSEFDTLPLHQAARLKTRIIQIKSLKSGERIGYGSDSHAKKAMTVALIPIGYADGFRRSLSNGNGKVFIRDHACSVAGNVCMDMTIIDISGTDAVVGDEVIVFDENHTISQLAKDMMVIPYEVVTGLSARVKRSYLME